MQTPEDERTGIKNLVNGLLRRKWLVFGVPLLCMVIAIICAIVSILLPAQKSFMPDVYTPAALLMVDTSSRSSNAWSSLLSSGAHSNLSNIAGLNGSFILSYRNLARYLLMTDTSLDMIAKEFNVYRHYAIPEPARFNARKMLKSRLHVTVDPKTGVLIISYTDIDPVFARDIVNYCGALLEKRLSTVDLDAKTQAKKNLEANILDTYNEILHLGMERQNYVPDNFSGAGDDTPPMLGAEYLEQDLKSREDVYSQLLLQYSVLKIGMASGAPLFHILEYADVPERPSGPNRVRFCVFVTLTAFFFSTFTCLVMNMLSDRNAVARQNLG
jgi:uncharacterized protein involved in exopolysaccharide biosynthesis